MTRSNLSKFSETELLDMKVKDLPIREGQLPFPHLVKRLSRELRQRGINWTPHIWASEEWFSPDGVCGFAIPFTLLDPRLVKLEKKYVGFYEGATEKEFIKLLRHECAHAIDNAFHLRKNKSRQKLFGKSSQPYPEFYLPRPYSKAFVKHLPGNYAQAHPEEDWAETFAVWIGPKNIWKKKYAGLKALDKLLLVDKIMASIKDNPPKSLNRSAPLDFRQDERTLGEYFRWRKTSLGLRRKNFYEKKLCDIFTRESESPQALDLLQDGEKELCRSVALKSRLRSYVVRTMLRELKQECKEKNYRIKYSSSKTKERIEDMLLFHSREYVRKKRHRIFM